MELTEQEYKQVMLEVAKQAIGEILQVRQAPAGKGCAWNEIDILHEFNLRFERAKRLVANGRELPGSVQSGKEA